MDLNAFLDSFQEIYADSKLVNVFRSRVGEAYSGWPEEEQAICLHFAQFLCNWDNCRFGLADWLQAQGYTLQTFWNACPNFMPTLVGQQQANKFMQNLSYFSFCFVGEYSNLPLRTHSDGLFPSLFLFRGLFHFSAGNMAYSDVLQYQRKIPTVGLAHDPFLETYGSDFPLLARYELKTGNQELAGQLLDILHGKLGAGRLTGSVLACSLASGSQEHYLQVRKLLLNAGLQEGLRSFILSSIEYADLPAICLLIDTILAEDLLRLPSVKGSVADWFFPRHCEERTALMKQLPRLLLFFRKALCDTQARDEMLKGTDTLPLFAGLFAAACEDIQQLTPYFTRWQKTSETLGTACFFLRKLPDSYCQKTALQMLRECTRQPSYGAWPLWLLLKEYRYEYFEYSTYKELKNVPPDQKQQAKEFYHLLSQFADAMGTKKIQVSCRAFPWQKIEIKQDSVWGCCFCQAFCYGLQKEAEELLDLLPAMGPALKANIIRHLLQPPHTPKHRKILLDALGGRANAPREAAYSILQQTGISEKEAAMLLPLLQSKNDTVRAKVVTLLKSQPQHALSLLQSGPGTARLAGLEIAIDAQEHNIAVFSALLEKARAIVDPTPSEQALLTRLFGATQNWTKENCFGLVPTQEPLSLPPIPQAAPVCFPCPWEAVPALFEALHGLVEAHAQEEYRNKRGETQLLNQGIMPCFEAKQQGLSDVDTLPLAALWEEFYHQNIGAPETLLQIRILCILKQERTPFLPVLERFFGAPLQKLADTSPCRLYVEAPILFALSHKYRTSDAFRANLLFALWAQTTSEERMVYSTYQNGNPYGASLFASSPISILHLDSLQTQVIFRDMFSLRYSIYLEGLAFSEKHGIQVYCPSPPHFDDLEHAVTLGILPQSELIRILTCRPMAEFSLEQALNSKRKSGPLLDAANAVAERICSLELVRGETPTDASRFLHALNRLPGIALGVHLLSLYGERPLLRIRFRFHYYPSPPTRAESICALIKLSEPVSGEDVETLTHALQQKPVSEQRLIELAMYNYKWTHLIAQYLGWSGFESGCWYFRAHTAGYITDEERTILRRFTPLDTHALLQGAFDSAWYHAARKALGDSRFQRLYEAAKYSAEGALHSRARKFADAADGKLDPKETQRRIAEKRNQDLLLAYCVIPLQSRVDLLERYRYLQQFLKEGATVGAKRRSSEKIAVEMALQNLAHNAGFSDAKRLTWSMEAEFSCNLLPLMQPQTVEDITFSLAISPQGSPSLLCLKKGKPLKGFPAKLRTCEQAKALKEAVKQAEQQYQRTRHLLEQAMVEEEPFTAPELDRLNKSPIIGPMLRALVFYSAGKLGYYAENALHTPDGQAFPLALQQSITLAHPVHLFASGQWEAYQHDIISRQLVQPFKQVFRELYRKLPEENEAFITRRYAGNQIDTARASALLMGRGWQITHQAIWKSLCNSRVMAEVPLSPWDGNPSETLEEISFYYWQGESGRLPIGAVPEIPFSELMRDWDLVVSVAHAGGSDPVFSHSTIAIRRAVVEQTLSLLCLSNVQFHKSHALIEGKRGAYAVHLGSGVVHRKAGESVVILPVHTQQRGPLFLPFLDDDPKTAEVLSKILLLAEDEKIRDPSILSQITSPMDAAP